MIIGLSGAKGSGKNTAAQQIEQDFGDKYDVKQWSFAGKLKQSAAEALGQDFETLEEHIRFCDELKETGKIRITIQRPYPDGECSWNITGREYLQWYGTEAHRKVFGDNFWIDWVLKEIPNPFHQQEGKGREWDKRLDLITDVRFPNEAEEINRCGGAVIKIVRPSVEDSGDTHASEVPLDDQLVFGAIINDKSIDDLRHAIRPFVNYIIELTDSNSTGSAMATMEGFVSRA